LKCNTINKEKNNLNNTIKENTDEIRMLNNKISELHKKNVENELKYKIIQEDSNNYKNETNNKINELNLKINEDKREIEELIKDKTYHEIMNNELNLKIDKLNGIE
jgi:predicted  nucleic acid-binding Zn-ribbon protein